MEKGCVFSYLITEDKFTIAELPTEKKFGKYTVLVDRNTPFSSASDGSVECAIFGVAVNVISGSSDGILEEILEKCKSIQDLIEYEAYLGGKYILLFRIGEQYYLQGDATCSIPCFYNTVGDFICSSNDQYIVKARKFYEDGEYCSIRRCGDISQAMPYDITSYREIKQLIPNHYLDINTQKSVRFINAQTRQKIVSVDKAVEITLPMIENILDFYLRNYKIYCPITSGRDSRVVLSFLMKSKVDFSCYTIKHPEHNDTTQDIVLPIELCKKQRIPHRLVKDVILSDEQICEIDALLGEGCYSKRTLRIGQTVREFFGDGAIINGDIIGQVGKCSLHRDIPSCFATPAYFRCKLHNYSREAKKLLRLWLKEIKHSGEKINTFDLFSVESRMGRWAAQENLLYNSLGQVYLNIFNSRSIIYVWTSVSRKYRKKSLIHIGLIEKKASDLLKIPFAQDESAVISISKLNGIFYLLSSFLKYYIEKQLFFRRKNHEKIDNNS